LRIVDFEADRQERYTLTNSFEYNFDRLDGRLFRGRRTGATSARRGLGLEQIVEALLAKLGLLAELDRRARPAAFQCVAGHKEERFAVRMPLQGVRVRIREIRDLPRCAASGGNDEDVSQGSNARRCIGDPFSVGRPCRASARTKSAAE